MADILVVEDDDEILGLIECLLVDQGHIVRTAMNGEQGLLRLSERLPELVLMDVEMPIMNGPAMVDRMFVENCGHENVPVLIVSGVEGLPALAAQVGTSYFLKKPFSVEDLLSHVEVALRERTPPRPSF